MTEEEAERLKAGMKPGEEDEGIKQIGSVNPIEDFKKMITNRKVDKVAEAIKQMQAIIHRYIRCSLDGDLYDKALECLAELRAACVKEDEAKKFNDFLHTIKANFTKFFCLLQEKNMSLITIIESELSSIVTEDEAI